MDTGLGPVRATPRKKENPCHRSLFPNLLQQDRELSLMTITDDVDGDVCNEKRLVIVMARSHPGEPLSSFVIQGNHINKPCPGLNGCLYN